MNKDTFIWTVIGIVIISLGIWAINNYVGDKNTNIDEEANETVVYCDPQSREGEFCTKVYSPVCGWFNKTIQCIKYPCAQNYGNSCEACHNPGVEYYTSGECPI